MCDYKHYVTKLNYFIIGKMCVYTKQDGEAQGILVRRTLVVGDKKLYQGQGHQTKSHREKMHLK